jgi:predicted RNA-binding protein YlxR (DUF448 family)
LTILKKPIRTCIVCRGKFEQNLLLRFKCKDKKLQAFDNMGRSFYICKECISLLEDEDINSKNLKKLEKALFRECKNKDNYIGQLKEILTHVR